MTVDEFGQAVNDDMCPKVDGCDHQRTECVVDNQFCADTVGQFSQRLNVSDMEQWIGDRLKKNVQATLKQPSSGPGGGIGLMQLARWSDGKLKAMFFPHDEGHDRFEVHVTIGKLPTKQQNTEGTT